MLKIYAISALVSIAVCYITKKAIESQLIREGHVKKEYRITVWESISNLLPLLIPIFNILIVLVCIFKKDSIKEQLQKENYMEMP